MSTTGERRPDAPGAHALDCIVVGAGLAGLLAAAALREAGRTTVVLEASASVGGRMATLRTAGRHGVAVWDTGAQFFTVRDEQVERLASRWRQAGLIDTWFRGLPPPDPPPGHDEPHLHVVGGMDRLPAHLAADADVRLGRPVRAVHREGGRWVVETAAGRWEAGAVVLALPVDQALEVLAAGGAVPAPASAALGGIGYDPTLALMAELDAPSGLPEPGAWHGDGEPLAFVADGQRKGLSDAPAVTVHAAATFSREHLDEPEERWVPQLLEAVGPLLEAEVVGWAVRRWRRATPTTTHPQPTLVVEGPAPLAFAGDAFDGPRVEGAARSGLAAGEAVVTRLA